jgi:hypothetical protein
MTYKEIIQIEKDNPHSINLFHEGIFYKAYERSAYMMCKKIHPFKVSKKFIKIIDMDVVSIGFPENSLTKWFEKDKLHHNDDGTINISIECAEDDSLFVEWKTTLSFNTVKEDTKDNIYDVIRNFPLESSTPIDCVNFIATLKMKVNAIV